MSRKCDLLAQVGVMSGNNVSHSNRKTRRKFLPNLCQASFPSQTLGVVLHLKVAASSLRTVNKYGDIDNFLINSRFSKLTDEARRLRNKIKKILIKKGLFDNIKLKTRKRSNHKAAQLTSSTNTVEASA